MVGPPVLRHKICWAVGMERLFPYREYENQMGKERASKRRSANSEGRRKGDEDEIERAREGEREMGGKRT